MRHGVQLVGVRSFSCAKALTRRIRVQPRTCSAWRCGSRSAGAHVHRPGRPSSDCALFSIPGADLATIYFATKPDRASDGSFLQENIAALDSLTTDEIQSGSWTYESQLDPGTYYVLLYATDFDCIGQPTCLDG